MHAQAKQRVIASIVVVLSVVGLAAGCSDRSSGPTTRLGPGLFAARVAVASSPGGAVKRLEWAVNHRDIHAIERLLTDDFRFITAGTDSAGNSARSVWTREMLLDGFRGLFRGTADRRPARRISLVFDQNLVAFPDTRPGKNPTWHRQVRTSLDFGATLDDGTVVEVAGSALFFVTRGDSIPIPLALHRSGGDPDSLGWWLDRWEDETLGGADGPLPGTGTQRLSLGDLLRLYLLP